jgi:hypothetical protein
LAFISAWQWLRGLKFPKFSIILSLLFLFGSPFIIGQSREYQLDFPNLAMIFFFLWRLESFINKPKYSNLILLGLSLGIGPMVKWHFLIYAPTILIIYFIRWTYVTAKYKKVNWDQYWFSSFFVVMSAIFYSGFWYVSNITRLSIDLLRNSSEAGIREGDPQGITIESFNYMIRVFTNEYFQLTWILAILALLVAACSVVYKRYKKDLRSAYQDFNQSLNSNRYLFALLLGLSSFLVMLLYHMNQSNKDGRYVIIFYPSILIGIALLGLVINQAKSDLIKKFVLATFTAVFAFHFLNLTLPINSGKESYVLFKESGLAVTAYSPKGFTNYRVRDIDWAIREALSDAQKENDFNAQDDCIGGTIWAQRATVWASIKPPYQLNTSPGGVAGLSEEYGFTRGGEGSCFIIVGGLEDFKKYEEQSPKNQEYKEINRYSDSLGSSLILYKKIKI